MPVIPRIFIKIGYFEIFEADSPHFEQNAKEIGYYNIRFAFNTLRKRKRKWKSCLQAEICKREKCVK